MASSADLVINIMANSGQAQSSIEKLIGTLTGVGGAGAAIAAPVAAATEWQDTMRKISVAYGNTIADFSDGSEKFNQVQEFLRDESTQVATSATDLASIYQVGARFAPESIQKTEEFTDSIAKLMKISGDLSDPTGTSQDIAKFLRIFNADNVSGVASAVAQLSTLHTQGESAVLAMAQNLALAGSQFGLTEGQVLGLSNVMVDAGIKVNTGGSSISRMFVELGQAAEAAGQGVDENSKKIRDGNERVQSLQAQLGIAEQRRTEMFGQHGLKVAYRRDPAALMAADEHIRELQVELSNAQQDLSAATNPVPDKMPGQRLNINEAAKLAGMSTPDFVSDFQSDPFGAFTSIIGGLHELPGNEQAGALGRLGIKNIRDVQSLEALAARYDQIGPNVAGAESQIANPTMLTTQSDKILTDTLSKWTDTSNNMANRIAELGEPMRQVADQALDFDKHLSDSTTKLDAFNTALEVATGLQLLNAGGGAVKTVTNGGGGVLSKIGSLLGGGATVAEGAGAEVVAGATAATAPILALLAAASTFPALAIKAGADNPDLVNYVANSDSAYADSSKMPQQIKIDVGGVNVAGASLQDVLNAVTAQITQAWDHAQTSQPVSNILGGNFQQSGGGAHVP